MKPIHKFNNGHGATLCHQCNYIISLGHTDDLYCNECIKNIKKRLIIEAMEEDLDHYSVLISLKAYEEEQFKNK